MKEETKKLIISKAITALIVLAKEILDLFV